MKIKSLILALLFCSIGSVAQAQTHKFTGTWTLSTDDTTAFCSTTGNTCSQNSYRAPGVCSATSVFTLLGSLSATATTFSDTTLTPGTWCYAVTFVQNGQESVVFLSTNSNFVTVSLRPSPQTGMVGVVQ